MSEEKRYRVYVCAGPNCTPRGSDTLRKALDEALWTYGLLNEVEVRVSNCQSRCAVAPNITIWPGPFRYCNLTPGLVTQIVENHLLNGEPVQDLLDREFR